MAVNQLLHVFVGDDSRETIAARVAAHSIKKRTQTPVKIEYLNHRKLRKEGKFTRPWLIEAQTGEFRDLIDDKNFSTEFSHTRFLVPALMEYKGWALFMDADMLFLTDIRKLFALCDNRFAVMCVKHSHIPPVNSKKMDGRDQLRYNRKNWSSFVLWNCGHPSNRQITPEKVSTMKGTDLHTFSWLDNGEIGSIPYSYNYISGVSPKLPLEAGGRPDVIHYTDGGPWFEECLQVPFADTWLDEHKDWQQTGDEYLAGIR